MWNQQLLRIIKRQQGFTLLDAVLGWVILGLVAVTLAYLLQSTVNSFSMITSRKEALAQVRYAADRITRELISIKSSDLTEVAPNQIHFLDKSGISTDFHSATQDGKIYLYRGSDLLAEGLESISFKYFDIDGNELSDFSDLSKVRRIQVNLAIKAENGFGNVSVRGEVYPRNFLYSNYQ